MNFLKRIEAKSVESGFIYKGYVSFNGGQKQKRLTAGKEVLKLMKEAESIVKGAATDMEVYKVVITREYEK